MSDRNTSERSGDIHSKNEASRRSSSWRGQGEPDTPGAVRRSASGDQTLYNPYARPGGADEPRSRSGIRSTSPDTRRMGSSGHTSANDERTQSSGNGNIGRRLPRADRYRPVYPPGATMPTAQSYSLNHPTPPLSQISTAPSTGTAADAPPLEAGRSDPSPPVQRSPSSMSNSYQDWQKTHHLGDMHITAEEEREMARSQHPPPG